MSEFTGFGSNGWIICDFIKLWMEHGVTKLTKVDNISTYFVDLFIFSTFCVFNCMKWSEMDKMNEGTKSDLLYSPWDKVLLENIKNLSDFVYFLKFSTEHGLDKIL